MWRSLTGVAAGGAVRIGASSRREKALRVAHSLLFGRRLSVNVSLETIKVEHQGSVQIITLNRPKKLNALSTLCCTELLHTLKSVDSDPQTHVSVITGDGKVFCAGADIEEMSTWTAKQVVKERKFYEWTDIKHLQKPIIAAVNGLALGGGCELAMLCDIIIASENSRFVQPETNVGLIPGMGGTQRLVRAVGKSKAMELILTGSAEGLTAMEAFQCGLVSRVVSQESVLEEALKIAQRIAELSLPVIMKAKKCVNNAYEEGLTDCLKAELKEFWSCFELEDTREGLQAFLQKRKPDFQNK